MEKIYVALLVVCGLQFIIAEGDESIEDKCTEAGFFPTSGNCDSFHRCVDFLGTGKFFVKFNFNCPVGTLWDQSVLTCNHLWAVDCPYEPASSTTVDTTTVDNYTGMSTDPTSTTDGSGEDSTSASTGTDTTGGSGGTDTDTTGDNGVTGTDGTEPTDKDDQKHTFKCDGIFYRHPLFCNKYYKCTVTGDRPKFYFNDCPPDFVYLEDSGECGPPRLEDEDCSTSSTQEPIIDTASTTPAEEATTIPSLPGPDTGGEGGGEPVEWKTDPNSLYPCTDKGYFPFEGDCDRFYKCVETEEPGTLTGLLYRCPEGHDFPEGAKWCKKKEKKPLCGLTRLSETILRLIPYTQLREADLLWFFKSV